jgi:hypothetical protein
MGTLHHWFKGSKSKDGKPGWVQADGSPCANEPGETSTPKCFSSARLKSLKKKGEKGESLIRSAVRRKRQKDKGQQAKSGAAAPTNVPTFAKGKKDPNYVKAEPGIKEEMELNEAKKDKPGKGSGKKDACYHKVKSRYDVWPSAYASGALVKCRKVGVDNWGTKSEAAEMIRYCPKCQKNETRSECRYGPKYWDMFSLPSALTDNQMKFDIAQVHPANEEKQPDHEHSMIRSELSTIIKAAKKLQKKVKGEGNVEAWVQSKITRAADYIDAASDYLESGEHNVHGSMDEEKNPCWKGYKQEGMKKKGNKMVPNCVPVSESRNLKTFGEFVLEAIDKSKMKCNSPKSDPVGDSLTGKSHVVKACEGGEEKIIRFGQRGVKGSPKKKGESEAYKNRRKRFKARHAKNIAKGKMSAAYWADKVKW